MMKIKKILLIMVLFAIVLILPTSVSAYFQSIPTNGTTAYSASNFFYFTRMMESAGSVMGLTETINSDNGAATSASNNIDVHMVKNTEWGAMAMLVASDYGQVGVSGNDLNSKQSNTTGNTTGVYLGPNTEFVAGIWPYNNSNIQTIYNASQNDSTKRYVDIYNVTGAKDYGKAKRGDATAETRLWYGATTANMPYYSTETILSRNKLFYFQHCTGAAYGYTTRAAIANGQGL